MLINQNKKFKKGALVAAGALFGLLGFGAFVQAATTDDLQKQINSLRSQMESDQEKLKINGFLSAGVAGSDVAAATRYSGINEDISFSSDSVVGVQLDFSISEDTLATVQFVGRGVDGFNADIEWAYLNHRINENYSFKVGRLRVPSNMASDYLEVGMAYPWVRPAPEMYDMVFFSHYDGAALTYEFNFGSVDSSLQLLVGQTADVQTNSQFAGMDIDFDVELGINYVVILSNWTFNLNYMKVDSTVDQATIPAELAGLLQLLELLGVDDIEFEKLKIDYINAGLTFDNGTWLIQAEGSSVSSNHILADSEAYYISIARRFGKWMPYVMTSNVAKRNNDDFEDIAGEIAMLPAMFFPGSSPGAAAASFAATTREAQKSTFLGVGYDLLPGVKVKAEWRYVEVKEDTKGTFDAAEFYADPFEHANVYSLVLDAVF